MPFPPPAKPGPGHIGDDAGNIYAENTLTRRGFAMKKIAGSLALAGFALLLAACGGAGSASDPKAITIATGGTGGTYYPLGGGMAQVFEKEMGITATAQVTGASVENMHLLSRGEVELAFTQNDIADYAVNGTEVFDAKLDNITGVAALY